MLNKFIDLEYGLILTNSYEKIYQCIDIPTEFKEFKNNEQYIHIKENEYMIVYDVKECFCNKNIIAQLCEKISKKLFKKYLILFNFDLLPANVQNNIKIFIEKNVVLCIFHYTKYSKILETIRSIGFHCLYKLEIHNTPNIDLYIMNILQDIKKKTDVERREIMYSLLINGMTIADIIKECLKLKVYPLEFYEKAAMYEHRSLYGNYNIYHLEAFINLLIKYE